MANWVMGKIHLLANQNVRTAIALFAGLVCSVSCPADPADLVTCVSASGKETKTIQNTFANARSAPCKTLYATNGNMKIAADAKNDVNKCLDISSRIRINLEHSGWSCHALSDPVPAPAVNSSPVPAATPPTGLDSAGNAEPNAANTNASATANSTTVPMAGTQRTAVRQIVEGSWTNECVYSYPSNWKRNAELSDGEIDVYPQTEDPIGRHNFVFSVGNARFSHVERVFLAGTTLPWEEVQVFSPTISKDDYVNAINLRASNPGHFISQHVLDSLTGGGDAEFEKHGSIELKGHYLTSEGFKTVTEKIDIIRQDQLLIASAIFLPLAPQRSTLADEPFGFTFSCSALSTMDSDAFVDLCRTLVEKATTNDQVADNQCEYAADGRLQFVKRQVTGPISASP